MEWASEQQRMVFEAGPYPVCASGGFGSAKTYACALKALYLSDLYPRNRGVIARKVHEELKLTTMSTFYKICPPEAYSSGGRRADSEKYLRLNNGSEVLFLHMDTPETEAVVRGLEINWFFVDQAEEMDEELFDLLCSRLGRWDRAEVPSELVDECRAAGREWPWVSRAGDPIPPTYAMLACNPDTELHWIYRRFHPDSPEHWEPKVLDADGGARSYHDLGYRMVTMRSDQNKFLPRQNLQRLLSQDESFVRRYVYGEWGCPEGQIHRVPDEAVLEPTDELIEYLRLVGEWHRTLDHGDTAPTCCMWWAVDREGSCFAVREYYKPDALVSAHREAITRMSEGEQYTFNLADPSIFFRTQQKYGGRWSVADEYADCRFLDHRTAIFWQPADNDEMATRNRINELLRVDPDRIHPVTKQRGAPRLFFVRRTPSYPHGCRHVLRETRSQMRMRLGTELGKPIFADERNSKIADHAYDCLRFFVASRPSSPVAPGRTLHPRSFDAVRREHLRWKRSGHAADLNRRIRRQATGGYCGAC